MNNNGLSNSPPAFGWAALLLVYLPFLINGAVNPVLTGQPWLFWVFEFISWILLPVAVFLFLLRKQVITLEGIGFDNPCRNVESALKLTNLVVVFTVVFAVIYFLIFELISAFSISRAVFDYQVMLPDQLAPRIFVAVYFAFTAAVVEEVYYRGILSQFFSSTPYGKLKYLLSSSLLFSLAHWEGGAPNIGATLVFGFMACCFFLKFRSLWPLVLSHFIFDLFIFW